MQDSEDSQVWTNNVEDTPSSPESLETVEDTADYETIQFSSRHPKCTEYHLETGQLTCKRLALGDIPNDGKKYKTVIKELELMNILDHGRGTRCGLLHWLYTFVRVSQDGKLFTVMLTDSCIDRLLGYNAQEFEDAIGGERRKMRLKKIRLLTAITESRLKLLAHWDAPRDIIFVSAITILQS
jgi:hypothetical protein